MFYKIICIIYETTLFTLLDISAIIRVSKERRECTVMLKVIREIPQTLDNASYLKYVKPVATAIIGIRYSQYMTEYNE